MAEREPQPGFTVIDRRRRGEAAEAPPAPPAAEPPREVPPRPSAPPPRPESAAVPRGPLRADLASLCVMLYSEALVHLGQVPDPVTGQPQPDPEQARFTIDMLSMLREKTEGNRTAEESAMLDEMLAALRMVFVRSRRPA